ncbi:MAG: sigma-70 family RNA polymerase sigma factor [Thermodesulfobacteriota bacterium]
MKSAKSAHERMISVLSLKNKAGWGVERSVSELPDEELVSLFVAGRDEEAFNELVNRYGDKVFRLAYRITNNQNDAEEILQEVFLILVEKLATFRKESRFSTWLYRVASNASFMYIRNSRRSSDRVLSLDDYKPYNDYGVLDGVEERDWSGRPDSELLGKEGRNVIEKAIGELPEEYRVVFHMKDIEKMTSKEISSILKLSVPAVKSRVLRARLFLRDKLSEYYSELDNG